MEAFLQKQLERNKRLNRRKRKDVDRDTYKAMKRAREAQFEGLEERLAEADYE